MVLLLSYVTLISVSIEGHLQSCWVLVGVRMQGVMHTSVTYKPVHSEYIVSQNYWLPTDKLV